jgi:hypothetical protein
LALAIQEAGPKRLALLVLAVVAEIVVRLFQKVDWELGPVVALCLVGAEQKFLPALGQTVCGYLPYPNLTLHLRTYQTIAVAQSAYF